MKNCTDFKEEKSAMAYLFEQLSAKGPNNIHLLCSPKYHPEIAGEGVEYGFGYAKKVFRSIALEMKKGKDNFDKAVRRSVRTVTRRHMNLFAAKCRRYMLAYMNDARLTQDGEAALTYDGIEKFQSTFKCHRNTLEQDKAFIAKVWRESKVRHD